MYKTRVSSEISSGNTAEVHALSKGGIPVLTWQLVALWLPFFFFFFSEAFLPLRLVSPDCP